MAPTQFCRRQEGINCNHMSARMDLDNGPQSESSCWTSASIMACCHRPKAGRAELVSLPRPEVVNGERLRRRQAAAGGSQAAQHLAGGDAAVETDRPTGLRLRRAVLGCVGARRDPGKNRSGPTGASRPTRPEIPAAKELSPTSKLTELATLSAWPYLCGVLTSIFGGSRHEGADIGERL
jgi:hypothetical protein